ncbi:tol-pal system-associated acyl-CoA thioesterase [Phaeovulum vinaykumarii]|uniref:Acyl-CoA thioester hydrolase n=1 Tax=Phaeovulum vinaykumarii TaxID=407234 RepID=A0A1N7K4F2_9RHOB|nr:tol-pal system-associated acyl-CoA thioesterase [Phaeovulum vinaykumarii]SIS56334.1 acyl-CoA thioester hydrolase [Phaeovulum vinaykumarii]SOB92820.1 acyl-CoA thioester hydrolase [Phaeovulum vinaykumarii]
MMKELGAVDATGGDRIPVRVYYEDTDLAGIVYYANYLRFIERGRTEYVRARGLDQAALKARTGVVFAVRRVEADYLSPARFDDLLEVVTRLVQLSGARIVMDQEVRRGAETLFRARVTMAALRPDGAPARLSAEIRQQLAADAG